MFNKAAICDVPIIRSLEHSIPNITFIKHLCSEESDLLVVTEFKKSFLGTLAASDYFTHTFLKLSKAYGFPVLFLFLIFDSLVDLSSFFHYLRNARKKTDVMKSDNTSVAVSNLHRVFFFFFESYNLYDYKLHESTNCDILVVHSKEFQTAFPFFSSLMKSKAFEHFEEKKMAEVLGSSVAADSTKAAAPNPEAESKNVPADSKDAEASGATISIHDLMDDRNKMKLQRVRHLVLPETIDESAFLFLLSYAANLESKIIKLKLDWSSLYVPGTETMHMDEFLSEWRNFVFRVGDSRDDFWIQTAYAALLLNEPRSFVNFCRSKISSAGIQSEKLKVYFSRPSPEVSQTIFNHWEEDWKRGTVNEEKNCFDKTNKYFAKFWKCFFFLIFAYYIFPYFTTFSRFEKTEL